MELALAFRWLRAIKGTATEIGAVTPYYCDGADDLSHVIVRVIDPTDPHPRVTDRCSLFERNLTGQNVISISTIEHVGTGDYDQPEEDCLAAIEKVLQEGRSVFITVPLGYNTKLDSYLRSAKWPFNTSLTIVHRSAELNDWRVSHDSTLAGRIAYGPLWANGLAVIERVVGES